MRKTISVTLLAAAAALVGCSKPTPGNGAASGNMAATGGTSAAAGAGAGQAASRTDLKLNPGLWETTVEMSMAGMPESVASAMKGTKISTRTCITPEQASKPSGEVFSGKKNKECTYKDYNVGNGVIRGTVVCTGAQGNTTMAMDGHYSGDSFDLAMKMASSGGPSGGGMQMETRTTGRRVGACTGKE